MKRDPGLLNGISAKGAFRAQGELNITKTN